MVNATLISRRALPLTFPVRRTPAAIRSIVPGPHRRSSSTSAAPSRACSHGRPSACTRPSRRSTAGATATILHQATDSPPRTGAAPVTTSAERPSPSESAPHRPGQRRHRDGHHHRACLAPQTDVLDTATRHDQRQGVRRHRRLLEKIGFRHRIFYRSLHPFPPRHAAQATPNTITTPRSSPNVTAVHRARADTERLISLALGLGWLVNGQAGVGSQGLPVRAAWMASMARRPWLVAPRHRQRRCRTRHTAASRGRIPTYTPGSRRRRAGDGRGGALDPQQQRHRQSHRRHPHGRQVSNADPLLRIQHQYHRTHDNRQQQTARHGHPDLLPLTCTLLPDAQNEDGGVIPGEHE